MLEINLSDKKQLTEKTLAFSTVLWCISAGWSTALINVFMISTSILLLIYSFVFRPKINFKQWIVHPAVILFFLTAVSIAWSEDFLRGVKNLKSYLPFLLFPLCIIFWYSLDKINVIYQAVKFLAYSLIFTYLITIIWNLIPENLAYNLSVQFDFFVKPFPFSNKSLFGWYVPFMERIHFSNILVYSGLSLIYIYSFKKNIFILLLSVLFLSTPFILGARASMIGVLMFLPVVLIYFFKRYSKKYRVVVLLVSISILSATFYIVYPQILSRYHQTVYELESIKDNSYLEKDYKHFPTLIRFHSWETAYHLFQERPIIGHGAGTYLYKYKQEYLKNSLDLPLDYHSQWLYFLGTFGLLGMIIFFVFYLLYFLSVQSVIGKYYLVSFSFYTAVIWIFDTGLLQKKEMMVFILFLSFALCLKKSDISYT